MKQIKGVNLGIENLNEPISELREWKDFMREEEFVNVVLDTHFYVMTAEVNKKARN
ncbi:hypothetical protein L1N85_16315 [Paenibacillus alkaliterrae]|uniref:hypothetical protein n=1 Tax=Paenibacillus alkaliterrae TaxID=320909 RepID=UPI001F3CD82E|nr:hypothetical protein [Paenibacillus alkaliterrae]MCF2939983.1 hypothetical protein [Paenibacillus alkaliterrae]